MKSHLTVPEVSLITSWYVPSSQSEETFAWLPAMQMALREGVNLLDLYFLSHMDIPWYAMVAGCEPDNVPDEPHKFAASLSVGELDAIAHLLRSGLTECYGGRLVGRRPRFVAFATFFPNISLPKVEDAQGFRDEAIQALRNSIYLAHSLGCHCVEIVGGAGIPGPVYDDTVLPTKYRAMRREALADSLCRVYDLQDSSNPLCRIDDIGRLPVLAVELEPGPSFLLSSLEEFSKLREEVGLLSGAWDSLAFRSLKLNVDVAHAFLIGYDPKKLDSMDLAGTVAHMHLSDHAGHRDVGGAHASDLPPGVFHFYHDHYRPWLRFAIEQASYREAFSGAIAMEMEACNDMSAVLRAVSTTRRWLQEAEIEVSTEESHEPRMDSKSPEMIEGILLVIDIGSSTSVLLKDDAGLEGCQRIEKVISDLCTQVHQQGGSVMSFTGDGFIALFEGAHFPSPRDAVLNALDATKKVCKEMHKSVVDASSSLTIRTALHWGQAYVPSSGPLRDQVIGRDIVLGTRLCDWLHIIEEARPPDERGIAIAATEAFHELLPDDERQYWRDWGNRRFKGLSGEFRIFQRLHQSG